MKLSDKQKELVKKNAVLPLILDKMNELETLIESIQTDLFRTT